jgi:hypothetical protein
LLGRPLASPRSPPPAATSASAATRGFLASYLCFSYRDPDARQLADLTPALRAQLAEGAARTPRAPAELSPRLLGLELWPGHPRAAFAVALIDDTHERYAITLLLERHPGGWQVAALIN